MITIEKIKIYQRYQGDIDSWARSGSKKEKAIMVDNDWYVIDGLIQDMQMIKNGLASLEFKNKFNERLKKEIDEQAVNLFNMMC